MLVAGIALLWSVKKVERVRQLPGMIRALVFLAGFVLVTFSGIIFHAHPELH